MTVMIRHLAPAVLALSLAIAGPARSQPAEPPASRPYPHCGTGVVFPKWAFPAYRAVSPDADGCIRIIRYYAAGAWGELHMWIEPAGDDPCADQFARENQRVQSRSQKLERRSGGKTLRLPGPFTEQHTARYTNPGWQAGRHQKPETVLTLWVGCIGPGNGEKATWLVRYEGDFAAADEDKVADLPEKLFAAIDWSPLEGK